MLTLEEYLEGVSSDDEKGDAQLWRDGMTIFRDHDPFLESLKTEYRDAVTDCAGIIMVGGEATIYSSLSELELAWRAT